MPRQWRPHVCALTGFVVLAGLFAWPLPLHLSTHLTGAPDGDTGVYVWNQWVFGHEILEHRSVPYFTDMIFASSGRANLGLHNYTTFANLIALPLSPLFGVVATFNLTYLVMGITSAYAMFLLARALGTAATEAWFAGVLFAWSPMLVTRGTDHFSLVAAAPLPLFVLFLLRAHETQRLSHAAALGATVAFAAWSDVYYAVYCIMLAAAYGVMQFGTVYRRSPKELRRTTLIWASDVVGVCLAGLVLALAITKGWEFTVFGRLVRVTTLYTPTLALTTLVVARVARRYRAAVAGLSARAAGKVAWLAVAACLVAAALLSPVLYAVGLQFLDGQFVSPRAFWRSSPAGVDLLAFLVPNPNHPLAPPEWGTWLARPRAALEHIASVPLMVFVVLALAWRAGWRPPRLWAALGAASVLVALGPFIHIAGVNTYVPGPWAILRYVPVIELARTPARFAVVVMLVVAVLVALALQSIRQRHGRAVAAILGVLLLVELLPAPRPLASASVPAVYYEIGADPREDVRVLELPLGISDGTFSVGRLTGRTQFYQTVHKKPIFGGGLSRVSRRRVEAIRREPILDALIRLSEGESIPSPDLATLRGLAPDFLERARIGYIVVDGERASSALIDAALEIFSVEYLSADGAYRLYRLAPLGNRPP